MEGYQTKISAENREDGGFLLHQRTIGKVPRDIEDDSIVGVKPFLDAVIKTQDESVNNNSMEMKVIPSKPTTSSDVDNDDWNWPVQQNYIIFKDSDSFCKEVDRLICKYSNSNCDLEYASLFIQIIAEHSYETNTSTNLLDQHEMEDVTSGAEIYRQFLTTKLSTYYQQLNLLDNTITEQKPKPKIFRIFNSMRKGLRMCRNKMK
ncbi:hypothetical protein LOTGIDRAFT_170793 [Lottia gigantea]|uniref:Uncharacterized protein n=1 Tax=Lottia gigantea TaxID=225164 RepID=V4BEZ2_LOTGI|nr:hypothetical protein LOTGIDRAFT_170793 [Lottia gigantea]ESP04402.1 hypothetical protein LOTGIDRAFT_170793 [Lottia gigantea]